MRKHLQWKCYRQGDLHSIQEIIRAWNSSVRFRPRMFIKKGQQCKQFRIRIRNVTDDSTALVTLLFAK